MPGVPGCGAASPVPCLRVAEVPLQASRLTCPLPDPRAQARQGPEPVPQAGAITSHPAGPPRRALRPAQLGGLDWAGSLGLGGAETLIVSGRGASTVPSALVTLTHAPAGRPSRSGRAFTVTTSPGCSALFL